MTRKQRELCHQARENGYSIVEKNEAIEISKTHGRWRKIAGILIYPDGPAFDLTVDLSVARGMRSYDDMRRVLNLPIATLDR